MGNANTDVNPVDVLVATYSRMFELPASAVRVELECNRNPAAYAQSLYLPDPNFFFSFDYAMNMALFPGEKTLRLLGVPEPRNVMEYELVGLLARAQLEKRRGHKEGDNFGAVPNTVNDVFSQCDRFVNACFLLGLEKGSLDDFESHFGFPLSMVQDRCLKGYPSSLFIDSGRYGVSPTEAAMWRMGGLVGDQQVSTEGIALRDRTIDSKGRFVVPSGLREIFPEAEKGKRSARIGYRGVEGSAILLPKQYELCVNTKGYTLQDTFIDAQGRCHLEKGAGFNPRDTIGLTCYNHHLGIERKLKE